LEWVSPGLTLVAVMPVFESVNARLRAKLRTAAFAA
jgi:hypothetical protein